MALLTVVRITWLLNLYRAFRTLCTFIAKYVMHIIVVMCAVVVVIATRWPVSHCRVTKQCRELDNHHNYVLMSRFNSERVWSYILSQRNFFHAKWISVYH